MFRPKYNQIIETLTWYYDMSETQILGNKSARAIEARRVLFHALKQLGWSSEEIAERVKASKHTIYASYRDQEAAARARTFLVYMEKNNGNA